MSKASVNTRFLITHWALDDEWKSHSVPFLTGLKIGDEINIEDAELNKVLISKKQIQGELPFVVTGVYHHIDEGRDGPEYNVYVEVKYIGT